MSFSLLFALSAHANLPDLTEADYEQLLEVAAAEWWLDPERLEIQHVSWVDCPLIGVSGLAAKIYDRDADDEAAMRGDLYGPFDVDPKSWLIPEDPLNDFDFDAASAEFCRTAGQSGTYTLEVRQFRCDDTRPRFSFGYSWLIL